MNPRKSLPMSDARRAYQVVAETVELPLECLTGDDRSVQAVRGRYMVMRLLRDGGASLPHIGHRMQRHHTSVLAGLREHEALLDADAGYATAWSRVRNLGAGA